MLTINPEGWLEAPTVSHGSGPKVRIMKARPRQNAQGKMFIPGGQPLAKYVMKRYGGPRCVWMHGTDVVPANMDKMANRTAGLGKNPSQRPSGYHFLLGFGVIYQFYSVLVEAWGAGRKLKNKKGTGVLQLARQGNDKALTMVDVDTGKWKDPMVDGRAVGNPNAWGPHIELVNWQRLTRVRYDGYGIVRRKVRDKMKTVAVIPPGDFTMILGQSGSREPWHNFLPEDLANLELLLAALYAGPGAIGQDSVFRHSRVGMNRIDPGPLCPVEDIAEAAAHDALELKDQDDSNEGDDEDQYQEPYEGPAQHD